MDRSYLRPLLVGLAWAFAVLSLTSVPAAGQAKGGKGHIRFEASIGPSDPFSDMNQVDPPKGAKLAVRRGDTFVLTVKGTPEKGWHTYPFTRRGTGQPAGQLGSMKVEGEHFQLLFPILESEPEWKKEFDGPDGMYLEHEKPFTVSREVYVRPSAPAGQTVNLTVKLHVQVCQTSCVLEDHVVTVPVPISEDPALTPTAELKSRLEAKAPDPIVVPLPDRFKSAATASGSKDSAKPTKPPVTAPPRRAQEGLLGGIVTALIGGVVSLLTPCVFPMIPITVSYFLKQSEAPAAGPGQVAARPHSALLMAVLYCATIVLVMTAGGMFLMQVLVHISNDYRTNLVLGAIFLVFALSLLGMYDITLPSWLQDQTASREGRGGLAGVFFMALTFSIISFTCVGPIYGSFITLQAAGSSAAAYLQQFVVVFAFSVAFAAPFFLLALFPSWLRSLPRAGAWMNSVKVVMGFLELAAAVKFLRAAEIAFTQTSTFLTFDLGLGIYIALSVACGLYLLGLYRLPHDHDAPESIGVVRLLFSLSFLTLALYLAPGLFKTAEGEPQQPRGEVYAWVESFLLPDTHQKIGGGKAAAGGAQKIVWHSKLADALAQAEKENKLVFIDFTGQLCTNCKKNERSVFPRPEVEAAFAKLVLLKLYTDTVPPGLEQEPGAAEAYALRDQLSEPNALPQYVLVRPRGGEKYDVVGVYAEGLIRDVPGFVAFLSQ